MVALRGARHCLEVRLVQAIYFEYFEKLLNRVQPPSQLLEFPDRLDCQVCFCRSNDVLVYAAAGRTRSARTCPAMAFRFFQSWRIACPK